MDKEKFLENLEKSNDFLEFIAVILCTNEKNIENFLKAEIFKTYLGDFKINKNYVAITNFKIQIFNFLINKNEALDTVKHYIKQIFAYNLFGIQEYELLIKKLEKLYKKESLITKNNSDNFYKSNSQKLQKIIDELFGIIQSKTQKEKLNILKNQLKQSSFSIAFTGSINAGKSTLINALLGKELLATSVVPETANLTILHYSNKSFAKVSFWSDDEYLSLEKTGCLQNSIQQDFKNHYIKQESLEKEISLESLQEYTSAKNEISSLIKSVELFLNFDFLKNNINIVDTPGLDDPVILREEITRSFMNKCDLMIHLMNVNQVATQKDIEFIVDSLLYGGISRILIILSRIDTVSKDELKEAFKYTEESIKKQLILNKKQGQLDSILEKIDFLPVSALSALMHKTKQKNNAMLSLEESGIINLEDYLENILFSNNNEKANLIINNTKKSLNLICHNSLENFNLELSVLGENSEDLKELLNKKIEENLKSREQVLNLKNHILEEKSKLNSFFITLDKILENQIKILNEKIKQRIIDDFRYEAKKNNKKPTEQRLKTMIEFGLKDGVFDIMREYKYKLENQINFIFENISLKENLNIDLINLTDFNIKDFLEENLEQSFLLSINKILTDEVLKEAKKSNIKKLEEFENTLLGSFSITFEMLKSRLFKISAIINLKLLQKFDLIISEPINQAENLLKEEESFIKQQIVLLEGEKEKLSEKLSELVEKIEKLQLIQLELK